MTAPIGAPAPNTPRVLVVGAGAFQLDILRTARRMGIETVAVDKAPNAPGMREADHAVAVDIVEERAVVEVAQRFQVQGVCTAGSDLAVGAVAAVASACGLIGLLPEVAVRCRDKLQTFETLAAANLAVPITRAVQTEQEALAVVRELGGYPVVVKPRSAAGGRGVAVVRSEAELLASLARARLHDRRAQGALVQAFVGGTSQGVEAFFWRGELAAAFLLDDQFQSAFVSPVGHSLPSNLAPDLQHEVRAAVLAFGQALGLCDGPANFDLRIENGRVFLIEVNARLGGNSITDLVRACHAVDLSAATLHAALGMSPLEDLRVKRNTPSASRLFIAEQHGILRATDPFADFREHPGIVVNELFGVDGQPATMVVDELTILGRCLVQGESTAAAVALCERVASSVLARVRLESA